MIRNDWVISPACIMARIFSQLALLISILKIFMVAVDRFILVVFTRSRRKITMKSAHIITLLCRPLALIIAIPIGLLSFQGTATHSPTRFNILSQFCNIDSSASLFVTAVVYLELLLGFGLYLT